MRGTFIPIHAADHDKCTPQHLAGVTSHPCSAWVTQQALNLAVEDRLARTQFLIRDRDAKYSGAFDEVFRSEGLHVIRTPIRSPRANASSERFVGTVRRECLDHILVLGERHLERILREYVSHYNEERPHRDYFELAAGFDQLTCSLPVLCKNNTSLAAAVKQAMEYCRELGVSIGCVTNGHQLVAFLASRTDGVPPAEGRALVFDSLKKMKIEFRTAWDCLSAPGVLACSLESKLRAELVSPPPEKLSARLVHYPGYKNRNQLQTDLQILGGMFLQDQTPEPRPTLNRADGEIVRVDRLGGLVHEYRRLAA